MSVSFKVHEDGLEHQFDMPDVPGPEDLKSDAEIREEAKDKVPKEMLDAFKRKANRNKKCRTLESICRGKGTTDQTHMWIKAVGKLSDDVLVHQAVLAYASDMGLMGTSQKPHAVGWGSNNRPIHAASLDHAMWFHRKFRADEWLLYALDSPTASNANGFNRGSIYTRDGILVASAVQERPNSTD